MDKGKRFWLLELGSLAESPLQSRHLVLRNSPTHLVLQTQDPARGKPREGSEGWQDWPPRICCFAIRIILSEGHFNKQQVQKGHSTLPFSSRKWEEKIAMIKTLPCTRRKEAHVNKESKLREFCRNPLVKRICIFLQSFLVTFPQLLLFFQPNIKVLRFRHYLGLHFHMRALVSCRTSHKFICFFSPVDLSYSSVLLRPSWKALDGRGKILPPAQGAACWCCYFPGETIGPVPMCQGTGRVGGLSATGRVNGAAGDTNRNKKQIGRSTDTEKQCATLHPPPTPYCLAHTSLPKWYALAMETKEASTQRSHSTGEAKLKTAHPVRCGSRLSNTSAAGLERDNFLWRHLEHSTLRT